MSILSNLIHGKNGKVSLTKATAWLAGVIITIQQTDPQAWATLPHWLQGILLGLVTVMGGVGIKNAIDKTAPSGTPGAAPTASSSTTTSGSTS